MEGTNVAGCNVPSLQLADPESRVHLEYGTKMDLSNLSMARLYTKLGFHVGDLRKTGMLHVNVFPRRLDRKAMLGNDDSILTRLPKPLLDLRETFYFECLTKSKALLMITSGRSGYTGYAVLSTLNSKASRMT